MADGLNITAPDLDSLNYTVHDLYNGTVATGGDSLAGNLNVFYEVRLLQSRHPGTVDRRRMLTLLYLAG